MSTAGAVFLNKQERLEQLRAAARRAAVRVPSVRRVVLFGSMAVGVPTPRSDADLLAIVAASEFEDPRERIPPVLSALSPLPCPIDLIVLTEDEVARRVAAADPLLREALSNGIDLL